MRKRRSLVLMLIITSLVLSLSIQQVHAATLFSDGFEDGTFDKWTDGGVTTWLIGQSGTPTGYGPHTGLKMAYCDSTHDGYLTSDNIDTSAYSSFDISAWYMDDDLDGGTDFEIYYYDNTGTYDLIVQLNPANEDQWYEYTATVTDAQYRHSTFRIRFSATPESNENAFVDDVTISAVYSYSKSASLSVTYGSTTAKSLDVGRGPSVSLSHGSTGSRQIDVGKSTSLSLGWGSIVNGIKELSRTASLGFGWTSEVQNLFDWSRIPTLGLGLASSTGIGLDVGRGTSLGLSLVESSSRIFEAIVGSSLGIDWTGETSRLIEITLQPILGLAFGWTGLGELSQRIAEVALSILFGSSTDRLADFTRSLTLSTAFNFTGIGTIPQLFTRAAELTLSFIIEFHKVNPNATLLFVILIMSAPFLLALAILWRR